MPKINRHPLNLLCRDHLRALGARPDALGLYSLQLVYWVLENRPDVLPLLVQEAADLVLRQAGAMFEWEPSIAQEWLTNTAEWEKATAEDRADVVMKRLKLDKYLDDPLLTGATLAENLWDNLDQAHPNMYSRLSR